MRARVEAAKKRTAERAEKARILAGRWGRKEGKDKGDGKSEGELAFSMFGMSDRRHSHPGYRLRLGGALEGGRIARGIRTPSTLSGTVKGETLSTEERPGACSSRSHPPSVTNWLRIHR